MGQLIKISLLVLFVFSFIFFSGLASAVQPSGANITNIGVSQTAPSSQAGSVPAQAGNVTELNLFGYTSTQAWQGYFGNVTGTIQLGDANGNVLYNWSDVSPTGEVYASTNSTIYWTNIQCFNYTATGTFANENGNGGTTNLYGTNLSLLQNEFGINSTDVDSVNNTFNLIGGSTHKQFYTANQQFTAGECQNTNIYDNTGAGESNKFAELLLYEPQSKSVVFTSLLNQNVLGFDNRTHDFEMLVLDNGHETDVSTTNYYFYVELQ